MAETPSPSAFAQTTGVRCPYHGAAPGDACSVEYRGYEEIERFVCGERLKEVTII